VQPDIELPDLLELTARREKDELNALLPIPVEGNKYFKPCATIKLFHCFANERANQARSVILLFMYIAKYISAARCRLPEMIYASPKNGRCNWSRGIN
jgi:hypothetical protein